MSLLDIDFKGAIIAIPSEAKENNDNDEWQKQETDTCHHTFVEIYRM